MVFISGKITVEWPGRYDDFKTIDGVAQSNVLFILLYGVTYQLGQGLQICKSPMSTHSMVLQ